MRKDLPAIRNKNRNMKNTGERKRRGGYHDRTYHRRTRPGAAWGRACWRRPTAAGRGCCRCRRRCGIWRAGRRTAAAASGRTRPGRSSWCPAGAARGTPAPPSGCVCGREGTTVKRAEEEKGTKRKRGHREKGTTRKGNPTTSEGIKAQIGLDHKSIVLT